MYVYNYSVKLYLFVMALQLPLCYVKVGWEDSYISHGFLYLTGIYYLYF